MGLLEAPEDFWKGNRRVVWSGRVVGPMCILKRAFTSYCTGGATLGRYTPCMKPSIGGEPMAGKIGKAARSAGFSVVGGQSPGPGPPRPESLGGSVGLHGVLVIARGLDEERDPIE